MQQLKQNKTNYQLDFKTDYKILSAREEYKDLLKWADLKWKEYYDEKWKQKLEGKLNMIVAVIEDFPIAYLWLDWTELAEQKIGVTSSFAVIPLLRSRGIGSNMMKFAENIFQEKGLKISQTGAYTFNTRAAQLYQKLGYQIIREEVDKFYFMEGEVLKTRPEVCVVLQKKL